MPFIVGDYIKKNEFAVKVFRSMGTARGKISYNRKDDLCDCRTHFVFVFLDVNVHALLWRWDVKAEVMKQTFFRDRRMIVGVSSNVYLLRVTLCLLRCSMPIIYLKDLLKWLWAFGPRASQKTTTTAKKKRKKHVSRAKQREHTHGFLEETQDKKSGGIFLLPLFCAIGSSFLSAKLRLKEYLKSGCDVQRRCIGS